MTHELDVYVLSLVLESHEKQHFWNGNDKLSLTRHFRGFFHWTPTGCDFKIWRDFIGKTLTVNQVEALVKNGKTGTIKGFTSKAGKKFDTALVLENKQTGKLGFPSRK